LLDTIAIEELSRINVKELIRKVGEKEIFFKILLEQIVVEQGKMIENL